MLNQFTLYKQCAIPTPTNVFLPTCSATALTDFFKAMEASQQYLTTTDNPIMAEVIRIQLEGNNAERDNLITALEAVNNPWYKIGKAARKFMANSTGSEDTVDPDLILAEKITDNQSELEQLAKKYSELHIDVQNHDMPKIYETYLDGVIGSSPFEIPELAEMMEKFEYTEGRTINLVPPQFKQQMRIKKSSQPVVEDEHNSFDNVEKSKKSYRL